MNTSLEKLGGSEYLYAPEKVREIRKMLKAKADLSCRISALQEELFFDITDGWGSGDVLLDFVLSSCLGLYDEAVVNTYRTLQESVYRHVGKYMLVIQKAKYCNAMNVTILRNIYLACVRSGDIEFDINRGIMGIPVAPKYLLFREMMDSNLVLVTRQMMLNGSSLYVGPLENDYCSVGNVKQQGDDLSYAHTIAPCTVLFHPWNMSDLERHYAIDGDFLRILTDWYLVGNNS